MSYTYAYPRPAVTVDALVMGWSGTVWKVLLVRRLKDPFAGKWALPGGFAGMEETLARACLRELEEETGLVPESVSQYRVFDDPHRDPRHRTLTVVHTARLPETPPVKGGDDAADADWFPVSELPPLAFDHAAIIGRFLSENPGFLQKGTSGAIRD